MTVLGALIRHQLDGPPDDQMICYHGEWTTRGWVRDFAESLSKAIDALGLPPGAPIGFVPHSRPEFYAATLALLERTHTIVMIYAYQTSEALARKLRELDLPAVIASREQLTGSMLEVATELGTAAIAITRNTPTVETLVPYRSSPDHRRASGPPALELLTSGTTGPPKLFAMSYDRLLGRMVNNNSMGSAFRQPVLLFFPLGNISGLYIVMGLILSDDKIILLDKYNVPDWVEFVKETRPKVTNLPPAAFRMILDAKVDPENIASIDYIMTGAATLSPSVRLEFEERYAPTRIIQSYGATEFGGVVAAVQPEHVVEFDHAKADSVGRPFGGSELRIVDIDTGTSLLAGAEGRIEVLAPAMSDEWITTTDLGVIDEDGFLYHRGRLDGAITRGGFKIMPETVAEALLSHPGVSAAAVVGRDDARLGQVPVAVIEPLADAVPPTPAELDQHVRDRLPSTMVPTDYLYVDTLPRTPSLKIDMAAVRHLFEEHAKTDRRTDV